jgi:hypothetical protein
VCLKGKEYNPRIDEVSTKLIVGGGDLDHLAPLCRDFHGSHGHTGSNKRTANNYYSIAKQLVLPMTGKKEEWHRVEHLWLNAKYGLIILVKSNRMPSKRSGFSATATHIERRSHRYSPSSCGGYRKAQIKRGQWKADGAGDLLKASRWISSKGTGHGRLR